MISLSSLQEAISVCQTCLFGMTEHRIAKTQDRPFCKGKGRVIKPVRDFLGYQNFPCLYRYALQVSSVNALSSIFNSQRDLENSRLGLSPSRYSHYSSWRPAGGSQGDSLPPCAGRHHNLIQNSVQTKTQHRNINEVCYLAQSIFFSQGLYVELSGITMNTISQQPHTEDFEKAPCTLWTAAFPMGITWYKIPVREWADFKAHPSSWTQLQSIALEMLPVWIWKQYPILRCFTMVTFTV